MFVGYRGRYCIAVSVILSLVPPSERVWYTQVRSCRILLFISSSRCKRPTNLSQAVHLCGACQSRYVLGTDTRCHLEQQLHTSDQRPNQYFICLLMGRDSFIYCFPTRIYSCLLVIVRVSWKRRHLDLGGECQVCGGSSVSTRAHSVTPRVINHN
jgi:hypothetical protein